MLQQIGVEDRPLAKYYTRCPKCGPDRDNSGKDSLGVFKVGSIAYLTCFHADQCEWNQTLKVKLDDEESNYEENVSPTFLLPVPDGVHAPGEYPGVTIYQYRDLDGRLQGVVKRKDNPNGKKEIRPFFYERDLGWISNWPRNAKLLYGAHLLKNNDKPVLIVEGEKAANAGVSLLSDRFITVTWPSGAASPHLGDWDLLAGREIYIWPDNDESGKKAAIKIAAMLKTSKILIFEVSHFGEGWDVADIEVRRLHEELEFLLKNAVPYSVAPIEALTKKKFKTDLHQKLSERRYGYVTVDKGSRPPESGLVIFLGRSAHGKSLYIYNLMKKQLDQGNKSTLFSYEIPASRAFVKLLMTYEHLPTSPGRDSYWASYHDALREEQIKAEEALLTKMETKQLSIVDKNYTADELLEEIQKPGYYGSVVFIDYIQLIPVGEAGSRYLEIQAICNRLREAANINNLLIVTAAQLTPAGVGKSPSLDHVREGKDIFFAAEQVFRIWNKAQGAVEGYNKYLETMNGDIILQTIKNRTGTTGKLYGFDLKNGSELMERL